MKANELLNSALKLLGYTDSDGNSELTQRIQNCAVVTVNLVYGDLWRVCKKTNYDFSCNDKSEQVGEFVPIQSLDDEIDLPQNVLCDVFLYGLAMHIARSENDGDQQQYFASLYNARRAYLTQYGKVKNILPTPRQ